jgi:hypothetical protein
MIDSDPAIFSLQRIVLCFNRLWSTNGSLAKPCFKECTMKTTKLLPLLFLIVAVPAMAANPVATKQTNLAAAELKVALAHAKMAEGATSLAVSQTHLHHVINCLVGPKGISFDAKAGNPCAKMGQGAINDGADREAARALLKDADKGLGATTLAQAQEAAKVTAAAIDKLLLH